MLSAHVSAWAEQGGNRPAERLDDRTESLRTELMRALQGDAGAAHALGTAYAEGGRAEDYAEAAHWFRRAADRGHPRAQSDLAGLYAKGLGVAQDYVQAYVWFELAARGFGQGARHDQAVELRDMMAAFMTPEQRAQAAHLVEGQTNRLEN